MWCGKIMCSLGPYLLKFHNESWDRVPWHTFCWPYQRYCSIYCPKTFCGSPSSWCSLVASHPSEAFCRLFVCTSAERDRSIIISCVSHMEWKILSCYERLWFIKSDAGTLYKLGKIEDSSIWVQQYALECHCH